MTLADEDTNSILTDTARVKLVTTLKTLNFKQLFALSLSLAGTPGAAQHSQGVTSQSVSCARAVPSCARATHLSPPIVCSFSFPSPQPQRVRIGKVGGKQVQSTSKDQDKSYRIKIEAEFIPVSELLIGGHSLEYVRLGSR